MATVLRGSQAEQRCVHSLTAQLRGSTLIGRRGFTTLYLIFRMLSIYRHRVTSALLFTNAILDVSPYLVRQSSILMLDRSSNVAKS